MWPLTSADTMIAWLLIPIFGSQLSETCPRRWPPSRLDSRWRQTEKSVNCVGRDAAELRELEADTRTSYPAACAPKSGAPEAGGGNVGSYKGQ